MYLEHTYTCDKFSHNLGLLCEEISLIYLTLVDATLFNIRRERRCEFIGEGMRWDDLMRWRAMDQLLTTKYIPEGFNFWDEAYDDYVAMKNDKGEPKYKIVSDGSSTANMSAKELGKYVRPYSIVKANNAVFDGYMTMTASSCC